MTLITSAGRLRHVADLRYAPASSGSTAGTLGEHGVLPRKTQRTVTAGEQIDLGEGVTLTLTRNSYAVRGIDGTAVERFDFQGYLSEGDLNLEYTPFGLVTGMWVSDTTPTEITVTHDGETAREVPMVRLEGAEWAVYWYRLEDGEVTDPITVTATGPNGEVLAAVSNTQDERKDT